MLVRGWCSTPRRNLRDLIVRPQALAESLEGRSLSSIPLCLDHDWLKPAGRILALKTSGERLWVEGELIEVFPGVVERIEKLKAEPFGFSIGFYAVKSVIEDGVEIIHKGYLNEISVVAQPGNIDCKLMIGAHPMPKLWSEDFQELFDKRAVAVPKPLQLPSIRYE